MLKTFFTPKPKPAGLRIGLTERAIVLKTESGTIPLTPDLAERLAALLPEYADACRRLQAIREAA